jgi:hypothetical protein
MACWSKTRYNIVIVIVVIFTVPRLGRVIGVPLDTSWCSYRSLETLGPTALVPSLVARDGASVAPRIDAPDMDESSFTNSALRLISQQRQRPKRKRTKRNGSAKRIMPSLYWKIMHRPSFLKSLNGWT